MIEAKPYKLFNKIQHYDWGTKNDNAFIPALLGIDAEKNLPYAELWIGAHPKSSSEIIINDKRIPLNDAIEKYPVEILGKETAEKFGNKLPFLLKVLSASRALSIQTHPNKTQAGYLHKKDPLNYPDDNHKPEIAVAIDWLKAVAGFLPVDEIVKNLINNPELEIIGGEDIFNKIINEKNEEKLKKSVEEFYSFLMTKSADKEIIKSVVEKIIVRLSKKKSLKEEEQQFINQYENYGADVGLLSFFFFNIINLKPGQAIFTEAGVPHAYLGGNIVECMANSDNVVRAGLTNKFKDVDTLLDIIKYNFEEYKIINESCLKDEVVFLTPSEEFQLILNEKEKGSSKNYSTKNKPLIILVLEGSIKVEQLLNGFILSEAFQKGESFLIPAVLGDFNLICESDSKFVIVEIPSI